MKFTLLSDLHLDFMEDDGDTILAEIDPKTDLLCIAGDICELMDYDNAKRYYSKIANRFQNVAIVPGNHEYLHCSPDEANEIMDGLRDEYSNLHILDRDFVTITDKDGKVRKVHGATLWYPDGELNNHYGREAMIDFVAIKNFIPWVYTTHTDTVAYFKSHVDPGDIILTHHAPHPKSIRPKFAHSSLNRFFVSNQEEIIDANEPAYWLHGHTHTPFDYTVKNTRVLCNPVGYLHEACNRDFKPLIIEI